MISTVQHTIQKNVQRLVNENSARAVPFKKNGVVLIKLAQTIPYPDLRVKSFF